MMLRALGLVAAPLLVTGCNGAAMDGQEQAVLVPPVAAATVAAVTKALPVPPTPPIRAEFADLTGSFTQGGWVRGKAPSKTVELTLDGAPVTIAGDDSFFAGFDRDASSAASLVATLSDGAIIQHTLSLSPRQWNIQRVNTNRGRGRNLEAYWKKREPEYNAIVAARAKVTGAEGWKQEFIWPVKGRISGKFGRQRIYKDEPGSYHSGLDIAPGDGVPFVAPADGVVVLARSGFSFEGNLIIIDHGAGLNSAFLHASKMLVSEGQAVKQGQHIGNVGSTGRATGPHLHWGLKWGDARIDPLLLVGPQ